MAIQSKKPNEILSLITAEASFEKCNGLHEYFERQVDRTPHAVALEYESSSLTYLELDKKANQLAHYLRERGIIRDAFVGLLMERSLDMFIGIIGTLKAGGAYVPIDPEHPSDRLKFLIKDIEATVVLTQKHLKKLLEVEEANDKILCLDEVWEKIISGLPDHRLQCENKPADLAYMIYTSGSTGEPKGCQITHQDISNYLQCAKADFPLDSKSRVLQKAPYTFDFSVLEIFWPLISGAILEIAKPQGHKDPAYIIKLIQKKKITDITFVPSMLQIFIEEDGIKDCASLKRIIAGGEILSVQTAIKVHEQNPTLALINIYGPTETTVAVTHWHCTSADKSLSSLPIGHVLPNNRVYILDEDGHLTPFGVDGELFIGGVQVARGYWRRPELTSEKFIKDPFSSDPQARMYKTGDRARLLNDGAIEYLGRIDFQVKIRGFRIELGEIEANILKYAGISQAAVVAKKFHGEDGPLSIVAYYTTNGKTQPKQTQLKIFLKTQLPDYMVPTGFVALDSLPLGSTGKVNRKLLTERHDTNVEISEENYSAPVNDIERLLVKAWETILKASPIGRDNNFFALGGDSLSLIRILHHIKEYNFNLQLEHLYKYQTVASLAQFIEKKNIGNVDNDISLPSIKAVSQSGAIKRYPLSLQQEGFWTGLQSQGFNSFIVYVNSLTGPLHVPAFRKSLERIMERHWVLRTKIVTEGKDVYQVVNPPEVDYFIERDFRNLSEPDAEQEVIKQFGEDTAEKLDVQQSPPFRCYLYKVQDEEHYIIFKIEHLSFDGVSLEILRKELKELYSAELEKRSPLLPEISFQFVDFAVWERETCNKSDGQRKRLNYWTTYLKGLPVFKLPTDFPKSSSRDKGSGRIERKIEKQTISHLITLNKKHNTTLYIAILTAFSSALQRWSRQKEVVFNLVISLRPSEMINVMGNIVTVLPIRINFENDPTVFECLVQVKERCFSTNAHLVHHSTLGKAINSHDSHALKQITTLFSYTLGSNEILDLVGVKSEYVELDEGRNVIGEINFGITGSKDEPDYHIIYDKNIFSDETIEQMADTFDSLLLELGRE